MSDSSSDDSATPYPLFGKVKLLDGKIGVIKYIGMLQGIENEMYGIELLIGDGNNDGKFENYRKFYCDSFPFLNDKTNDKNNNNCNMRGIFVNVNQIETIINDNNWINIYNNVKYQMTNVNKKSKHSMYYLVT